MVGGVAPDKKLTSCFRTGGRLPTVFIVLESHLVDFLIHTESTRKSFAGISARARRIRRSDRCISARTLKEIAASISDFRLCTCRFTALVTLTTLSDLIL